MTPDGAAVRGNAPADSAPAGGASGKHASGSAPAGSAPAAGASAEPGGAPEAPLRERTTRSGTLMRRIAVAFLGIALAAIAVSCALVYGTTRTTYQESQSERLAQILEYVEYAVDTTASMDGVDMGAETWIAYRDELDPDKSASDWIAETNDIYQELATANEEAAAIADEQGEDSAAYEEATARMAELEQRYDIASTLYYWYSLENMFERVESVFGVTDLSLFIPDAETQQVTFIVDCPDTSRLAEGESAHLPGDQEERSREAYPELWSSFEAGEPSPEVSTSPDGALYCSYRPITLPDGQTWLCEVTISTDDFNAAVLGQVLQTLVIMGVLFTVLMACLLLMLRRTIVRPLSALARNVRSYAADKSPAVAKSIRDAKWPNDEVGMLADDTADMIDETHAHLDNIVALNTERERVRSELEIAGRIQVSALPEVRPPFTGNGEFDLAVAMRPAKAVGGDFYDFFLIDAKRIGIVIADVSDKGVPAALFMMRAKALIKQLLSEGLAPAQAMQRANEDLCRDNKESMFVTVWMGVIDLTTGSLLFANGGHNPPLLRHGDGSAEWLRQRSGMLLGCFEDAPYRGCEGMLHPDDMLLLYTDGVTEAMDESSARYGEDRLAALVQSSPRDIAPEDLTAAIERDVEEFAGEAEQADDITLLVLRFDGVGKGVRAAGVEADS